MNRIVAGFTGTLLILACVSHAVGGEPAAGAGSVAEAAVAAVGDELKSGWSYEDYKPLLSYQTMPVARYFAAKGVPLSAGFISKSGKEVVLSALEGSCRKMGGEQRIDQGYAGWRSQGMERFFKVMHSAGLGDVQNVGGDDVSEVSCNKGGQMLAQTRLVRVGTRFGPLETGVYDIRVVDVSGFALEGDKRDAALMAGAVLGNKLAGDELLRAAAERQKSENERQRKAEAAANEELRKATESLRTGLKRGDDTNCGLVIEVKPPIAQMQTASGVQWMRIDAVYPLGVRCDFNGSGYQKRTLGF